MSSCSSSATRTLYLSPLNGAAVVVFKKNIPQLNRSENTVNHNNHLRPLPVETMPHKSYILETPCALDHLSSQHKEVSMRFSDENMTIYESQRDRVIAVSPSLLEMDEQEENILAVMAKGLNS